MFGQLESEFRIFLSEQGNRLKSEFFIPTVVGKLVKQELAKVAVLECPDSWFGITYPEDRTMVVEKIRDLVNAGHYPTRLFR